MTIKPIYIFTFLSIIFIIYSLSLYSKDEEIIKIKNKSNTDLSDEGKLLWQKHNCQACHQIYSLGGYLGPDLTNVYSKYNNEDILKAFMKGGFKQMPSFDFNEKEQQALIDYFKKMDKTGKANIKNFDIQPDGMIKPKWIKK